MATRSGGRYFKNVGSFEEEYCFNALIIDDSNMYSQDITPVERLERFCYVGDDRNICMRYIMGKEVEI
jgi:guanine deaminase